MSLYDGFFHSGIKSITYLGVPKIETYNITSGFFVCFRVFFLVCVCVLAQVHACKDVGFFWFVLKK